MSFGFNDITVCVVPVYMDLSWISRTPMTCCFYTNTICGCVCVLTTSQDLQHLDKRFFRCNTVCGGACVLSASSNSEHFCEFLLAWYRVVFVCNGGIKIDRSDQETVDTISQDCIALVSCRRAAVWCVAPQKSVRCQFVKIDFWNCIDNDFSANPCFLSCLVSQPLCEERKSRKESETFFSTSACDLIVFVPTRFRSGMTQASTAMCWFLDILLFLFVLCMSRRNGERATEAWFLAVRCMSCRNGERIQKAFWCAIQKNHERRKWGNYWLASVQCRNYGFFKNPNSLSSGVWWQEWR